MRELFTRIFGLNPRLTALQRRRAQFLYLINGGLLALVLLIGGVVFFTAATDFGPILYLLVAAFFVPIIISLSLNRAGLLVGSSWVLLGSFLAGASLYLLAVSSIDDKLAALGGVLVLPVLASAMLLGPRVPFLVAGICCALLLVAEEVKGSGDLWKFLVPPVVVLIVSSLLAWSYEASYRRLVRQLTHQNRELVEANKLLESQRNLELKLSQQLNQLAGTAQSTFVDQNRGANDQHSAIIQVTTALVELNYTNEQIAQAAYQVADTAKETLDVAERGSSTIRYSLDGIRLLHDKVNAMANAMQNLTYQAREIDQIIELITEIADETNLLALNATIEAAGAKEYGRRFAAVAGEVQRLANRSRDAAEAVRGVVNEVQAAIKTTTYASQEGLRDALELTGNTREIGEAIEGIVAMVQTTTTLAQQISLSIQQQKSAGVQVLETMRQITDVSDQVALTSRMMLLTMKELNLVADQLRFQESSGR